MTKAHEQRVKNSLERARVRLARREVELDAAEKALVREREDVRRERTDAVALLQLLCERYGEAGWAPETALSDIVERHLMDPLMQRVGRLRARAERAEAALTAALLTAAPAAAEPVGPAAEARPPTAPPSPPRRLFGLPEAVHRVMVVESQDAQGRRGHACRCTCGWVSYIAPSAAEAWREAGAHEAAVAARSSQPQQQPQRGYAVR